MKITNLRADGYILSYELHRKHKTSRIIQYKIVSYSCFRNYVSIFRTELIEWKYERMIDIKSYKSKEFSK